jgi:N-methylhydantoinase A
MAIRKVIVPYAPGYFSAYGMLFSDLRYDYVRSVFRKLADVSFEEIEALYRSLEDEGRAALAQSGVKPDGVVIERAADMRYVGQEHAVTVDLPLLHFAARDREAIKRQFDELHKVRYGTSAPAEPADLVSLRVTVLGTMKKPPRHSVPEGGTKPDKAALRTVKPVYFAQGGWADTPVYRRDLIRAGNRISGPALVEEHASTTVLQPGDELRVDELGNLQLSIGSDRT